MVELANLDWSLEGYFELSLTTGGVGNLDTSLGVILNMADVGKLDVSLGRYFELFFCNGTK